MSNIYYIFQILDKFTLLCHIQAKYINIYNGKRIYLYRKNKTHAQSICMIH